jgi:hypothetical protein
MMTAHDHALLTQTQGHFEPALDAMLAKPLTASTLFDTVSSLLPGALAPAAVAAVALAGEAALTDVRILVVDDNAMNQLVAL